MVREFNYPKEAPSEGIKRDLQKIKEATEWQTEDYENEEKINQEKSIELGEYDAEAKKIFNEAHCIVSEFLRKQNISTDVLNVDKFNVFVTESEDVVVEGAYNPIHDRIYINKSQLANKEKLKHIFTHEIFHKISFSSLHMTQYSQEDNEFINKIKTGYSSEYSFIEEKPEFVVTKRKGLFGALNEGVTELLTTLALEGEEEERNTPSAYELEMVMTSAILSKVYGQENFKEFMENYFSGEMMHLRKIEKYYGKESLYLLSIIQTKVYLKYMFEDNKKLLKDALEFREVAIEFFVTNDDNRRQELRSEIGLPLE